MATEKTPNYSTAQVALILAAIEANGGVGNKSVAETLAANASMNTADGEPRNYRSIIAKMNRMNVPYERKVPTAKDGSAVEKKIEIVAEIATLAGVAASKLDTLEKSSKGALQSLRDALATGTDG